LFNLDRILVSTEEFFALYRGIAEASNDPAFGLKLGTEERVERYDPVKLAALSARSFRDAVERLSRYKQLTCPEEIRLPFLTYNADLVATVAPQLEAELTEQLAQKTFREQAKGILKQLLAGQRPGIQDLGRELHLSTRTLQRRLTEQRTTFQRLLDEARRELARHYLLHSSRELNETAYLLGYEDANSFFRAFHHWEGTSPGQWRLLQKNGQPATRTQAGAA
jgi:AraC-like DNA-binding protein